MLRAEQWMMVGVVAIGAYAAYRLTKADSGTRADRDPIPTPVPRQVPFPLVAGDLSYGAYR